MTQLFIVQAKFRARGIQPVSKFIRTRKKDGDILSYCENLDTFHSYFNKRFDDTLKMNIHNWILYPFLSSNIEDSPQ